MPAKPFDDRAPSTAAVRPVMLTCTNQLPFESVTTDCELMAAEVFRPRARWMSAAAMPVAEAAVTGVAEPRAVCAAAEPIEAVAPCGPATLKPATPRVFDVICFRAIEMVSLSLAPTWIDMF
ncbi:hypothetical protein D3C86_1581330 [compost metagenome]